MAIDSSIYHAFSQPVKSVADYDNENMQAQQNRLALAMQQQKANEYTRSLDDANKLRGIVGTFTDDRAGNQQKLLQAGRLPEAETYGKETLAVKKADLENQKAQIEQHLQRFAVAGQIMAGVKDQATWDQARAQTAQAFGPEAAAQMPAIYDPQAVEQKRQQAMPVQQQLQAQHQQIADKLAADKFAYDQKNDAANRGVTIRGQDMTASTAAAGRAQADRHFNTTQAGSKVPAGYRMNADGTMSAIPGGPADIKQGAEAAKKVSEAKDVLGLLDEVDTLLPKATSGYGGAALDTIAGAFGKSTEGAQTTAQLKAIEGALISKMPKMSGPQSDKDVLLYRQMAGQVGDATIPVAQRQAAAAMVRRLNEKYAGMPEGSSKKSVSTEGVFNDPEKERRYQEWKAKQGK